MYQTMDTTKPLYQIYMMKINLLERLSDNDIINKLMKKLQIAYKLDNTNAESMVLDY
jgi:hypothetical protein